MCQISNIIEAIKAGSYSDALKAELEKMDNEKNELLCMVNGRNTRTLEKIPDFLPRAIDRYKALFENLEEVSQRDVSRARY